MLITEVRSAEVRRALEQAVSVLNDTESMMRTLANAQYKSTVENFKTESFGGEAWPPLADSTADAFITGTPGARAGKVTRGKTGKMRYRAEKGKRRGYDNILRPTGKHIFQTISPSHSKDEARVTCACPWAFVHNFGAPMAHFQMPRRTFMGITDQDEDVIFKIASRYVRKALGI